MNATTSRPVKLLPRSRDSAGADQPHGAALDLGAAALAGGHHALGLAARLTLAPTIRTLDGRGGLARL
jgi:hypothetical protein